MRLATTSTPEGSISEICDRIIHDSQQNKNSSRLKQFSKSPIFNYSTFRNRETLELTKGLFDCVKTDISNKVLCTDLIEHLISIGVNIDPMLFTQIFKKFLKVSNISEARIDPEEFNAMLFDNKKADKIIEVMKKHLKPRRTLSLLPKIKKISAISPSFNFQFRVKAVAESTEELIKLVRKWWSDLCPQGGDCIPFSLAAQLLVDKEIVSTFVDAKKIFNNVLSVSEEDFLGVFCVGIVKLQVLEAAKKVNAIGITKPCLSAYQKLSSVKRKLLISRISPERGESQKTYAEKAVNGLINYRLLKQVLK